MKIMTDAATRIARKMLPDPVVDCDEDAAEVAKGVEEFYWNEGASDEVPEGVDEDTWRAAVRQSLVKLIESARS